MTTLLHPLLGPVLAVLLGAASPILEEPPVSVTPDLSAVPTATVLGIDDGDVITVQQQAGGNIQIRLAYLQIPADESARQAAKAFLRNLLAGEKVWVIAGAGGTSKDARWYVFRCPDRLFVNLEAVRQGYADMAVEPKGSASIAKTLRYWRDQARHKNKGIWIPAAASQPASSQPAARTVAVPSTAPVAATIVYISSAGKKYHRANCKSLHKSSTPIALDEARKSYDPCKQCDPPK